jgi:hypothetical protein
MAVQNCSLYSAHQNSSTDVEGSPYNEHMMTKFKSPSDVSSSSGVESIRSHGIDEMRATGMQQFSCCEENMWQGQCNRTLLHCNNLLWKQQTSL